MVRTEIYNLRTRLAQFKDQKKLKTYLIVIHYLQIKLEQLTGQKKKAKIPIRWNFALKHKSYLVLSTCHKYVVEFTEPTPTIYLYAKRNKLTFLNMPVLNTIQ